MVTVKAIYLISSLLMLDVSTAFQLTADNKSTLTRWSALNSHSVLDMEERSIDIDRRSLLSSGVFLLSSAFLNCVPQKAFAEDDQGAVYAYRSGGLATLRPIGITKLTTRYEGYVEAPKGSSKSQIPVSFEFPSDWLQLDKLGGGIQYVDQRNGDKLYVLKAALPADTDLKSVSKNWFADVILSPNGDVIKSGVQAEGGRVSRSQMLVDCTADDAPRPCTGRRRMILKYDTVTGSGVQTVERRGLIDAHQIENEVYMMVTTSNAVKFEQKGSKERETVENICQSFKIGL